MERERVRLGKGKEKKNIALTTLCKWGQVISVLSCSPLRKRKEVLASSPSRDEDDSADATRLKADCCQWISLTHTVTHTATHTPTHTPTHTATHCRQWLSLLTHATNSCLWLMPLTHATDACHSLFPLTHATDSCQLLMPLTLATGEAVQGDPHGQEERVRRANEIRDDKNRQYEKDAAEPCHWLLPRGRQPQD